MNHRNKRYWTPEEDQLLQQAQRINGSNWKLIAQSLIGRNPSQCIQRWKRIKPESAIKNNKWTQEEDQILLQLCAIHQFNWSVISTQLHNRTGRQVRERYINHLDPSITKDPWTEEEDEQLWDCYKRTGSKWSEIALEFNGRTENMVKNRFYSHVRQRYGNIQNPYYVIPQTNDNQKNQKNKKSKKIKKNKNQLKTKSKSKSVKKPIKVKEEEIQEPINLLEQAFPFSLKQSQVLTQSQQIKMHDQFIQNQIIQPKEKVLPTTPQYDLNPFRWDDSLRMLLNLNSEQSQSLKRSLEFSRMAFDSVVLEYDNTRLHKYQTPCTNSIADANNINHSNNDLGLSSFFSNEILPARVFQDLWNSRHDMC